MMPFKDNEVDINHNGFRIFGFRFNSSVENEKGKIKIIKEHLLWLTHPDFADYPRGSIHFPNETWGGEKLTSMSQGINEAKFYIDKRSKIKNYEKEI